MLGAIIGDVAGSIYEEKEVLAKKRSGKVSYEERIKILDKNIPLFTEVSSVTDDSILTTAIADALINNKDYGVVLREYGQKFIDTNVKSKFGGGFVSWLEDPNHNNSYGNGCSMRISPVPELFDNLEKVKKVTGEITRITHNHPEAILCAEALATCIFFAKNKKSKNDIKNYVEGNYFKLDYDLKQLQRNYEFTSRAINSVPPAIYVFLVSNDFEDAIRKAISIGGDSDTIACMVGSIAENYYGIPDNIKKDVERYIPNYMEKIIKPFYEIKEAAYVRKPGRKVN